MVEPVSVIPEPGPEPGLEPVGDEEPLGPHTREAGAPVRPVVQALRYAHPLRVSLHNEVHARPYESMAAPLSITHVGLVEGDSVLVRAHLDALLALHGQPPAAIDAKHLSTELHVRPGELRLRWEQHTEFQTLTFWRALDRQPAACDAAHLPEMPAEWLTAMPGQWLIGLHVLVVSRAASTPEATAALVRRCLDESTLVCSSVMDGHATMYTDFRLHEDGCGRWIIEVGDMNRRRLGRAVQRALEIETYRMMSLLGLPAAREVGSALAHAERDLAEIAAAIRSTDPQREPELLRQLTNLAASVESLYARTHARFSASAAYFELVQRRIAELREQRIHGLQTLGEFMERRLAPAMQTCAWAERRQQALSQRISRASNLLRTRVEIEQQQSSRDLLDAMNRRQEAQLLLQSAVEGLSVAAITYYGSGLVGYLAKGAKSQGLPVSPDLMIALSIPLIALSVWWGGRQLHHRVMHRLKGRSNAVSDEAGH
ncbi:MAG: hypothetical protein RLZZ584_4101 [Pseudomonadota bacterium]